MKFILVTFLSAFLFSCNIKVKTEDVISNPLTKEDVKSNINTSLDLWHKAAAETNFESYFNLMTNDAVFIGTDPTENWKKDAFKTFSKPYFDKGKAWSFSALERNIYLHNDNTLAWFDELLDTQMKLCRGSGVLKFEDNTWKVAHYVLSIAIPNENTAQIVKIKTRFDTIYIQKIKDKR